MAVVSEKSTLKNPKAPQILVIGDALIDRRYRIERLPVPGGDTIILSTSKNIGGSFANLG